MLILSSCGAKEVNKRSRFRLGEHITIGPIGYLALGAEYRPDAGSRKAASQGRFLFVNLSITNTSMQDVTVPLTRLIGPNAVEYSELTDLEGVSRWLGLIRRLPPNSSEQGYIVFDVPGGAYRLQVSSGGDPETEEFATIEIPAMAPQPTPSVPGPTLGN